jgi:hypothetical protein
MAVQGGIVREILADGLGDAVELALDDPFLGFPSLRQQYVAITRAEPEFGTGYGA